MKKLLAIAVVTVFAAPMAASADVTIGGNLNQEYIFGSGNKNIVDDSGDNEITIRASTPLSNGMTGTASINHEFNASGNKNDSATNHTLGKLGIKGGFGHVTIGDVSEPMDGIDGVVGFLPKDFDYGNGEGSQGINYTGAFGPVGITALVRPGHATTATGSGTKSQLGLTYKAGPISAGLGIGSGTTGPKTRLALAYNAGNYSIGGQVDKNQAGDKASVIGGKYNFGKAFASASFGKKSGVKGNAFKLGYALGASTDVYFASSKDTGATRVNKIGINQKF